MQVCHNLTKNLEPSAVALGCFDGLHLGHRQVIGQAAAYSTVGLMPTVFTFEESPLTQLKGKGAPMLTTNRQKLRLLEECGVRRVYMIPFEKVRHMGAKAFVREILLGTCNAQKVFCGFNFHFGEGGKADSHNLQQLCAQVGIEAVVIPAVQIDGSPVSSTRIRSLIEQGDMERAASLLGRCFGFDFPVIHGRELGRRLGTPTINQPLPQGFVLPRFGVYASVVTLPQGRFAGVTNVGVKPTVGSTQTLAETWINGYEGELYGQNVQVELLEFLRAEQKFASLEELKNAIVRDGKKACVIAAPYL